MMQRNEIEKLANSILKQFNIENEPFSHIKEICDQEKITIKKTNFTSSVDGAFSIIQNKKYIFYNPKMIEERVNFTKAHELGHYYLKHHLECGNTIYCYNKNVSEGEQQSLPKIETEANYFASYFLMPEDMVLKEFANIKRFLSDNLYLPLYVDNQPCHQRDWNMVYYRFKNCFGVSKTALGYRLDSLGLIKYRINQKELKSIC